MDINDLICLAKKASTPDIQYVVEFIAAPGTDAQITVRRCVEMTGLETVYSSADTRGARPLEEGIARMQSEVEAFEWMSKRENKQHRPIGVKADDIVAFIAEHERMNSGEGASSSEIAAHFGLSNRGAARYHLIRLLDAGRIHTYEDPITLIRHYKVVKHR